MLLLFWPALGALIGVAAAQRRGFSVVGGAIGGMLLGLLSPLLFLVSPTQKKCPSCDRWVSLAAKACPHCTREIADAPAVAARLETPPRGTPTSDIVTGVVVLVVLAGAVYLFVKW